MLAFAAMRNLNSFQLTKLTIASLALSLTASAADLPSKKHLDLKSVKTLVAGAEAEAERQHVSVTICIVDDSGNILFLQKGDTAPINTLTWAQKKARHSAFYNAPTKNAEDFVKSGHPEAMGFPDFFPIQGGVPVVVDGQLVGGMAASGSKGEIDEAVAKAGVDALSKK